MDDGSSTTPDRTQLDEQFAHMVKALAKPGAEILNDLGPGQAHLIHMMLGICGEAGELLDAIKKRVIYQKPIDLVNVKEELGDLEFYLQGLRSILNITREETLLRNIAKLSKRYPDFCYSDAAARERADKVGD